MIVPRNILNTWVSSDEQECWIWGAIIRIVFGMAVGEESVFSRQFCTQANDFKELVDLCIGKKSKLVRVVWIKTWLLLTEYV